MTSSRTESVASTHDKTTSPTPHGASKPSSAPHSLSGHTSAEHGITEKDVERAENPYAAKAEPVPLPPGEEHFLTGVRLALVAVSINLFVFLVALDQTIVSTAVPVVTNDFNSFSDVGWYGSAYLLTATAFQPLFGRLYTSFSLKYVYLLSLFIFEVGSLICGVAQDSPTFIVGRAIAGLGSAGGYAGSMIIINIVAPLQTRPLLTSLLGGVYGIGATIGPIIGGAFTSHTTWRWCFYINLVFYAIVGPAILFVLHTPKVQHEKSVLKRLAIIDWLGSILVLCSLICILLVFQWGGVKYPWSDSRIIGLIVGCVAIGVSFVVLQYFLGENATIPFRILKQRTVGFGTMVNFGVAAAYFSELYFLPIYFQSVRGSSAIRSGVQTLPFIVALIFTVSLTGMFVNKTGIYIPFLLAGTALTALGGGMLYFIETDSSQARWAGLEFFAGFGPGMAWMLPFIASSAALEPQDIALGSAVVIFFQTLGGAIFVSVAQSVFQNKFVLYLHSIPGADVEAIISKGVSAFPAFTPPEILPAVLEAANRALQKNYIMVGVLGATAFCFVLGMELNRRIPIGTGAPAPL